MAEITVERLTEEEIEHLPLPVLFRKTDTHKTWEVRLTPQAIRTFLRIMGYIFDEDPILVNPGPERVWMVGEDLAEAELSPLESVSVLWRRPVDSFCFEEDSDA